MGADGVHVSMPAKEMQGVVRTARGCKLRVGNICKLSALKYCSGHKWPLTQILGCICVQMPVDYCCSSAPHHCEPFAVIS